MALQDFQKSLQNRNTTFNRRYETRVFWFPEDSPPSAIVETQLFDSYHDMTLYLRVDLTTLKISDMAVEEKRVPYKSCPQATAHYKYLIGMDMSERKLTTSYPERKLGCLHLNELIENAARGFSSAYGFYLKEKILPPEVDEYRMSHPGPDYETRAEISRHWWTKDRTIRNSCYSFSDIFEQQKIRQQVKEYPSLMMEMLTYYRKKK